MHRSSERRMVLACGIIVGCRDFAGVKTFANGNLIFYSVSLDKLHRGDGTRQLYLFLMAKGRDGCRSFLLRPSPAH
jgi:hypothetical protein